MLQTPTPTLTIRIIVRVTKNQVGFRTIEKRTLDPLDFPLLFHVCDARISRL